MALWFEISTRDFVKDRRMALWQGFLLAILVVDLAKCHFINQWAVEIEDESQVDAVAAQLNCQNKGKSDFLLLVFYLKEKEIVQVTVWSRELLHRFSFERVDIVCIPKRNSLWALCPWYLVTVTFCLHGLWWNSWIFFFSFFPSQLT